MHRRRRVYALSRDLFEHITDHIYSCVPLETISYPLSFRSEPVKVAVRQSPAYSTDGTCGPTHGNTICDPNSTVYTGTCCSVSWRLFCCITYLTFLSNTAGVGILLLTVERVVYRVAQALLSRLRQLLRLALMEGVVP